MKEIYKYFRNCNCSGGKLSKKLFGAAGHWENFPLVLREAWIMSDLVATGMNVMRHDQHSTINVQIPNMANMHASF